MKIEENGFIINMTDRIIIYDYPSFTCKVKYDRAYSIVILLSVTLISHVQVRSINKRCCHPASARQFQYSK